MEPIVKRVDGNKISVTLSREIYENEAITEAAYKVTGECTAVARPLGETEIEITFEPKEGSLPETLEKTAADFCNDVLDAQLRLELDKRYGRIKELIVKHAFSPLENLKEHLDKV